MCYSVIVGRLMVVVVVSVVFRESKVYGLVKKIDKTGWFEMKYGYNGINGVNK